MSRIPTYILAPNFTLQDGAASPWHPWLGNIIADPMNPTTRVLNKLTEAPKGVVSIFEEDNEYVRSSSKTLNGALWATFLQTASGKIGGGVSKDISTKYRTTGIETRYFDPDSEELTARIQSDQGAKIRAAINTGLSGRRPVYIITGLKIARGFSLETSTTSSRSGNASLSAPITPDGGVSLGAEVAGSTGREQSSSFRVGRDEAIIFAYQVHLVSTKGWREKTHAAGVYSKPSFFGKSDGEEPEVMEATAATKEDLEFDELEPISLQSVEICGQDQDRCMCILPEVISE